MLLEEINQKIYKAQKEKDTQTVGVLRFLVSAIQNKKIELRTSGAELTDEIIEKVIHKQIKQRKESLEMYESAGREESAKEEKEALAILQSLTSGRSM